MKLISIEEFQRLIEQPEQVSVSIYMPTERAGKETQQNAIRFKNLLRRTELLITERQLLRPRQARELLQPAHDLLRDVPFWQHQWDGLAVFLSPELYRHYRVPIRFTELAEVRLGFHLKPLLRLLSCDGEFLVLSLNRKNVRLLHSTRYQICELDLGETPTDFLEFMTPDTSVHQLQWRTAAPTGRGERSAVFHGHGGGDEDLLPELRKFLAAVDRGVLQSARGKAVPLLLAGPEDLLSLYREISDYPHLVADELRHNTSDMRDDELRERAWELVQPLFVREQQHAARRFREMNGTGMASADLREIVPASHDGRVESLFVARGSYRWGRYDVDAREVRLQQRPSNDGQDLLDLSAVQTLLHHGKVFVVDPENIPDDGGPIAAVFRY